MITPERRALLLTNPTYIMLTYTWPARRHLLAIRGQFHLHFMGAFFVQKRIAQLLSNYILALKFLGPKYWCQGCF